MELGKYLLECALFIIAGLLYYFIKSAIKKTAHGGIINKLKKNRDIDKFIEKSDFSYIIQSKGKFVDVNLELVNKDFIAKLKISSKENPFKIGRYCIDYNTSPSSQQILIVSHLIDSANIINPGVPFPSGFKNDISTKEFKNFIFLLKYNTVKDQFELYSNRLYSNLEEKNIWNDFANNLFKYFESINEVHKLEQ